MRGAEDSAFQHGYLLITFPSDDQSEREKQILSLLRSRRADGILLVVAPSLDNTLAHIRKTEEAGIQIVCLDRIPNACRSIPSRSTTAPPPKCACAI